MSEAYVKRIFMAPPRHKTSVIRALGLVNILITGSLTVVIAGVVWSGMQPDSRCEFCAILVIPGLVMLGMLIPGFYALSGKRHRLYKNGSWLNIMNIAAIGLSVAAVVFNRLA